jgi:Gas vesicle synthesis protein GvpL/GvpF
MVLNAAFLLAPERLNAFQETLTSLVERHGARGFRFDFTGPWPPYHFAGGAAGAAGHVA